MRGLIAGLLLVLSSACSPLMPGVGGGPAASRSLGGCGEVEVHVVSRHSADVQVMYAGRSSPRLTVSGMSEATHRVPRGLLRYPIKLRIIRGGLDTGSPPVETELVSGCDATLFVGGTLNQSYFFGADVRRDR